MSKRLSAVWCGVMLAWATAGGSGELRAQAFAQGGAVARSTAIARGQATAGIPGDYSPDSPGSGQGPLGSTGLLSRTASATVRRVSVNENGRQVSIEETAEGITVTVDGRVVRAANPSQLKRKNPDAYRLYERHLGSARGEASARVGSSKSSGKWAGGKSTASSSADRRVSTNVNGKQLSIIANDAGITVNMDGQVVKATDAEDLKKKSPQAFQLYEQHLGASARENHLNPSAKDLLREELNKLREAQGDSPQLQQLLDKVLQDL